jgi:hypothetical protein
MKIRRRALAAPFVLTAALGAGCYIVPEPAPAAQKPPTAGQTAPATGTAAAQPAGAAPAVVSNPPPPGAAQPAPASAQPVAATTPTPEEQRLAEQAVHLVEEMGRIADSYPGDCDKAAAELKTLLDKNRDLLAAAKAFGKDPGKSKWLEDTYGARMGAAMNKLMPLVQKCSEHPGMRAVLESMQ